MLCSARERSTRRGIENALEFCWELHDMSRYFLININKGLDRLPDTSFSIESACNIHILYLYIMEKDIMMRNVIVLFHYWLNTRWSVINILFQLEFRMNDDLSR